MLLNLRWRSDMKLNKSRGEAVRIMTNDELAKAYEASLKRQALPRVVAPSYMPAKGFSVLSAGGWIVASVLAGVIIGILSYLFGTGVI